MLFLTPSLRLTLPPHSQSRQLRMESRPGAQQSKHLPPRTGADSNMSHTGLCLEAESMSQHILAIKTEFLAWGFAKKHPGQEESPQSHVVEAAPPPAPSPPLIFHLLAY